MKEKITIKLNQIWKSKLRPEYKLIICGVHGGRWKAKVLGDKPNVFRGSHTLTDRVLRQKYDLEI